MYQDTTALQKIEQMDARINIIQGGARAGKTTAMIIRLCDLTFAVEDKLISVVSDTYPNLEKGAIRDWEKLLKRTHRERYFTRNKVKHTWTNKITGTTIEFFSCEADDALGAGRDYLFINEAYRVDYKVFDQLMLRTEVMAWLDFNPVNEFWVHTEIMQKRTDWQFLKLTYLDNEGIPPAVLSDLLQHRGDGTNNWWRVYGLGEIGALEGNIYSGWIAEDELPPRLVFRRYGVDFGYNDPTVIIGVWENPETQAIYLKLCLYQTHLTSKEIVAEAVKINAEQEGLFVCDNAKPEMIQDLCEAGLRAIPCNKSASGKVNGKKYNINLVQEREVHYLRTDKPLEQEYLTYPWRVQKSTGKTLDEPEDGNDHCMDALAYAVRDMERKQVEYGAVRF